MPEISPSTTSCLGSIATVAIVGIAMAGAFTAAAICPILTPVSAAALGVIFSAGVSGGLISGYAIKNTIVRVIVAAVIIGVAIAVGLAAMGALGLPFSALAVTATAGFTLLYALATFIALVGICSKCCPSPSSIADNSHPVTATN